MPYLTEILRLLNTNDNYWSAYYNQITYILAILEVIFNAFAIGIFYPVA